MKQNLLFFLTDAVHTVAAVCFRVRDDSEETQRTLRSLFTDTDVSADAVTDEAPQTTCQTIK